MLNSNAVTSAGICTKIKLPEVTKLPECTKIHKAKYAWSRICTRVKIYRKKEKYKNSDSKNLNKKTTHISYYKSKITINRKVTNKE